MLVIQKLGDIKTQNYPLRRFEKFYEISEVIKELSKAMKSMITKTNWRISIFKKFSNKDFTLLVHVRAFYILTIRILKQP
jgi:hypothetical protein